MAEWVERAIRLQTKETGFQFIIKPQRFGQAIYSPFQLPNR